IRLRNVTGVQTCALPICGIALGFRVDVVVGKGAGASAIPLPLPRFTVVGATTRAGLLPAPLRDRFGFTGHMEFYEDDELQRVLKIGRASCRERVHTSVSR